MTLLLFILIMAILVIVHEFGHFIVARKNGVKVEEFGIGFPPRLFSFKRPETTYSLNLIPLGGFVRIKGETGDHKNDPDSYANKKPWQKALILVAGVAMNFLTGWLLLSLAVSIGVPIALEDVSPEQMSAVRDIGIRINNVLEKSPASEAGIKMGDMIESINGEQIQEVGEIQKYINEWGGKELDLKIKRGEEKINLKATPIKIARLNRFAIGIGLSKTGIISYPWPQALGEGLNRTIYIIKEIAFALGQLAKTVLTFHKPSSDVSGPVAIAVATNDVAKLGFAYLLQFMAVLSLNLAFINILPIPALDGGRLFFLIIEKLRGRPIGERLEIAAHNIGFTLLIILMVFVTISDIGKYGGVFLSTFKQF